MLIEVFKFDAERDRQQIIERIEIVEIDTSRIAPVNKQVGSTIAISELEPLITQIKPVNPMDSEEPESYHAQNIAAWQDSNLFPKKIDLPHHIGLRVALRSILQKYSTVDDLQIQIS